jgi:hypothetical protein
MLIGDDHEKMEFSMLLVHAGAIAKLFEFKNQTVKHKSS